MRALVSQHLFRKAAAAATRYFLQLENLCAAESHGLSNKTTTAHNVKVGLKTDTSAKPDIIYIGRERAEQHEEAECFAPNDNDDQDFSAKKTAKRFSPSAKETNPNNIALGVNL